MYLRKRPLSFADAVAALRRATGTFTIFSVSPAAELRRENASVLLDVLAEAA